MNLVSYSLFGSHLKYITGAIRNAEDVPKFYPDFRAIFYCHIDVPAWALYELESRGAIIERESGSWPRIPTVVRHTAAERSDANVVLVRDADSRLSDREARAVAAWLASDKNFHCMRDFPCHIFRIMGGMWGIRKPASIVVASLFREWCNEQTHPVGRWRGVDQRFLAEKIWPQVCHTALQHDSFQMFSDSVDFPTAALADGSFVGEIWDEYNKPTQSDRDVCYEARKRFNES